MSDELKVIELPPKERTMVDAMGEIMDLHKNGEVNKESAAVAALFLGQLSALKEPKKEAKTHGEVMKRQEARAKL